MSGRRHHHYAGKVDSGRRLLGLIMNSGIRKCHLLGAILVFVVLSVMFLAVAPWRTSPGARR